MKKLLLVVLAVVGLASCVQTEELSVANNNEAIAFDTFVENATKAMHTTANLEAFRSLAWTRQQTKLLGQQMEHLKGVPEVPGSYFTGRTVTLAFNDAYIEMENPYKALSERVEDLNDEITRKYEEFGLY